MKTLLLTPLAAVALLAAAGQAHAFGHHRPSCAADCGVACAPKMTIAWVEQTVIDYKTEWQTKDCEVEVDQPFFKEEVKTYKRFEEELAYTNRKDIRPIIKLIPRSSMKEITTYKMEPCTTTDPCTGKCSTTYSVKVCVENIPVTVYESVQMMEPIVVTTAYMKPVEKTYQVVNTTTEYKKVKMIRQEKCLVRVPYQKTIQVPVHVPCDAPLAAEPELAPPPLKPDPRK